MSGPNHPRGATNRNDRGSAEGRRRRREWLVDTYRADVDGWPVLELVVVPVPRGAGIRACRCYRCGTLLIANTVTVDRIVPGCKGGTYRRDNIRPACGRCNSITGVEVREAAKSTATLGGKPASVVLDEVDAVLASVGVPTGRRAG